MTRSFQELLLSELRMVTYIPGISEDMTDDLLCKAVTLNVNLQSLGYILKPNDILLLSVSPSLDKFYEIFASLVPDVKAEPMYPGFPSQVMEMTEAEFRLHQYMHYFSTYGMESMLGNEVHQGWLPEYNGPERTEKDTILLNERVIELIPEQDAPATVLGVLLNRRERLSDPELDLVLECAPKCSAEQMQGMTIRFKENLRLLFPLLMDMSDRKVALTTLFAICQHSGDVFRCIKDYLQEMHWHLKTSDKKLLVKLLECYPVLDMKNNMMQSRHLRERNLNILKHLDYNRFSRSEPHREAVRALRNGELLSWNGVGELLLKDRNPEALIHYSQRPGYMVRIINRLLSLGYSRSDIEKAIFPVAGRISGHLILKTIRTLMKRSKEAEEKYQEAVSVCNNRYMKEQSCPPPDIKLSFYLMEVKAKRKEEEIVRIWWDLPKEEAWKHACVRVTPLQNELLQRKKEIAHLESLISRIENMPNKVHSIRNANMGDDLYVMFYRYNPDILRNIMESLNQECRKIEEKISIELETAKIIFAKEMIPVEEKYVSELKNFEEWKHNQTEKLKIEVAEAIDRYNESMRTLQPRWEQDLLLLKKNHEDDILAFRFDDQTVEILKTVLKMHFRNSITPLKGKKVFLDLEQFDLVHSILETEDRSRDGGYIRSGISYKIPENARFVRFFIYWNDKSRVDLDLHAGGVTTEGKELHVGWNSDYRSGGVIHSGDITHSNAAEYIDIDLQAPVREIYTNVCLFSGKRSFKEVGTCYVGMMAVDSVRQNVKLYDPANCFFTHTINQNTRKLHYGYIDVQNRYVRYIGQSNQEEWASRPDIEARESRFSLKDYLDCILEAQKVHLVNDREKADVVLTMGKSLEENFISLVDHNFFLES